MLEGAVEAKQAERIADQRADADLAHQAQWILAMRLHAAPVIRDPRRTRPAREEEVAAAIAAAGEAIEGALALRKVLGDRLRFGEADAKIGILRRVLQK